MRLEPIEADPLSAFAALKYETAMNPLIDGMPIDFRTRGCRLRSSSSRHPPNIAQVLLSTDASAYRSAHLARCIMSLPRRA